MGKKFKTFKPKRPVKADKNKSKYTNIIPYQNKIKIKNADLRK